MKLCSRCKKRPAVVFLADASTPGSEPQGLCLVCAKELGIKPVDDMLKRMNISDEDIEQMSDQFMDLMSLNEENENDDAELNDETFDLGTAPAFPFWVSFSGAKKPKVKKVKTERKTPRLIKDLRKNAAALWSSIAPTLPKRQKRSDRCYNRQG